MQKKKHRKEGEGPPLFFLGKRGKKNSLNWGRREKKAKIKERVRKQVPLQPGGKKGWRGLGRNSEKEEGLKSLKKKKEGKEELPHLNKKRKKKSEGGGSYLHAPSRTKEEKIVD